MREGTQLYQHNRLLEDEPAFAHAVARMVDLQTLLSIPDDWPREIAVSALIGFNLQLRDM